MNIVIAGGSGLVGTALIPKLQSKGYSVDIITRYPDQPMPMANVRYFHWDAEISLTALPAPSCWEVSSDDALRLVRRVPLST